MAAMPMTPTRPAPRARRTAPAPEEEARRAPDEQAIAVGVEPLVNMLERRVRTDQRKAPDDSDAGGGEYEDGDDAAVVEDAEQAEQGQRPQDVDCSSMASDQAWL